jgi:MinD superfamily P-loop ATPase
MNTDKNRISIAIASGKGGTGKTLVSVSMFHTIANKYEDVVLVDSDAEEPNDLLFFKTDLKNLWDITQKVPVIDTSKCTYCGKCHDWCNYNAIFIIPPAKIIKVIDELCHGCGACTVACKYGAISEKAVSMGKVTYNSTEDGLIIYEARMNNGTMTPVPVIKASQKHSKKHKIRIIDSPPGTSCPFIQTVAGADYVILVTEPTPFGLSDLKQSVETLKTMNKYYGVIINRAGLGDREIYNYLDDEDIELLGEITFDRNIALHYSEGRIISEVMPDFSEKLEKIFDYLLINYGTGSN